MKNIYIDIHGVTRTWETPDIPVPLDQIGVVATLNAVLGVWSLSDAANVAGVTPDDLIREAQAWAVAQQGDSQ
jgi:hypothetical protein